MSNEENNSVGIKFSNSDDSFKNNSKSDQTSERKNVFSRIIHCCSSEDEKTSCDGFEQFALFFSKYAPISNIEATQFLEIVRSSLKALESLISVDKSHAQAICLLLCKMLPVISQKLRRIASFILRIVIELCTIQQLCKVLSSLNETPDEIEIAGEIAIYDITVHSSRWNSEGIKIREYL